MRGVFFYLHIKSIENEFKKKIIFIIFMSKIKILICGFGYTSQFLVKHFDHDYRILSRNYESLESIYKLNKDFFPDIVLDTIPPVYENHELQNPLYKNILLELYHKKPFVYIHISSTSVYPDITGEFNELSEIPYLTERGKKRWDLEEKILEYFPYALIIRSGGIYGPERNLVLSLKNRDFSHLPTENKVVYRIHVYDLCQIILVAGSMILNQQVESSVFPGYIRNNLINAIYPYNEPISEVLKYIKDYFKIELPETYENLKIPSVNRQLKSLYSHCFEYRFSDYKIGFKQCFS